MAKYKIKYRVLDRENPRRVLLSPTQTIVIAASETNAISEVKKKQSNYMKVRNGELDIISIEKV
ncbi:hypothetical protein RUR49_10635 [Pseudoxanthobacter sp. M-2]|uniref:hypothetical protein n=1 Tax=Pseudoxanthobacter sp. M-2 TaxID=3078754 RepID=UPI0038FC9A54